jgi:Tol biopolymer transport system component
MSMTPDERAVQAYLQPLRTLPAVTRQPAAERRRGRWFNAAEFIAVAIAVILLAGLVALVASNRSRHHRPITPPHRHPRSAQLTYLSNGDIAEGPTAYPQRWVVRGRHIEAFAWSPDGQKVAYLARSSSASHTCAFYILDLPQHTTTSATPSEARFPDPAKCEPVDEVAWSPDGRHVAYVSDQRVIVVNVATGSRRLVARAEGIGLTWWPGGRLAYPCHGGTPAKAQWCSILPDGSQKTRLNVHGWDVTWSPAARRVAYFLDPRRGPGPGPGFRGYRLQVWTATPSGARVRLRLAQRKECCIGIMPYLAWSPDGRHLVATGAEAQSLDLATGDSTQLWWWSQGSSPLRPSQPAWRP